MKCSFHKCTSTWNRDYRDLYQAAAVLYRLATVTLLWYNLMLLSAFLVCLSVSRLIAGAPKEKALSLKNVNETGAVYSCPITTDTSDCSRMDLVSTSKQKWSAAVLVTGSSSLEQSARWFYFTHHGQHVTQNYEPHGGVCGIQTRTGWHHQRLLSPHLNVDTKTSGVPFLFYTT